MIIDSHAHVSPNYDYLEDWDFPTGREVRVCAPPDCAAAEECDAPVATGVMPTGGWR